MATAALTLMRRAVIDTLKSSGELAGRIRCFRDFAAPGAGFASGEVPAPAELDCVMIGPAGTVASPWEGNQFIRLTYALDLALWTRHEAPDDWERLYQYVMRALHQSTRIPAQCDRFDFGQDAAITVAGRNRRYATCLTWRIVLEKNLDFRVDSGDLD